MPIATPAAKPHDGLSRSERKDQTRTSLLQSALQLIGQDRSFASLGIREIARGARVVPNGSYRHFSSTDGLGLALVEDAGVTLRRLLRQAGVAKNRMM